MSTSFISPLVIDNFKSIPLDLRESKFDAVAQAILAIPEAYFDSREKLEPLRFENLTDLGKIDQLARESCCKTVRLFMVAITAEKKLNAQMRSFFIETMPSFMAWNQLMTGYLEDAIDTLLEMDDIERVELMNHLSSFDLPLMSQSMSQLITIVGGLPKAKQAMLLSDSSKNLVKSLYPESMAPALFNILARLEPNQYKNVCKDSFVDLLKIYDCKGSELLQVVELASHFTPAKFNQHLTAAVETSSKFPNSAFCDVFLVIATVPPKHRKQMLDDSVMNRHFLSEACELLLPMEHARKLEILDRAAKHKAVPLPLAFQAMIIIPEEWGDSILATRPDKHALLDLFERLEKVEDQERGMICKQSICEVNELKERAKTLTPPCFHKELSQMVNLDHIKSYCALVESATTLTAKFGQAAQQFAQSLTPEEIIPRYLKTMQQDELSQKEGKELFVSIYLGIHVSFSLPQLKQFATQFFTIVPADLANISSDDQLFEL
ncbi:MAG: hypothetical protein K0U13_02250 [Chlamydiae bacterium]|nr:hypothetical protein [Chlamydiales bacterium]MCH9703592.1 hypothetical protein [Chlamydiota bacterium]